MAHRISVLFYAFLFTFQSIASFAADVTLAWDPNSEQDLKGYGIYTSEGRTGPPYQLVGYIALSEFNNSEAPTFTVADLEDGVDYAIAVTAYNAAGAESAYSEPVCLEAGAGQIDCASISSASVTGNDSGGSSTTSSSSGGGAGGGGGGCFIQSLLAF